MKYSPDAHNPELMRDLNHTSAIEAATRRVAESWIEDPRFDVRDHPELLQLADLDVARELRVIALRSMGAISIPEALRGSGSLVCSSPDGQWSTF